MKKILLVLLICIMVVSLFGCDGDNPNVGRTDDTSIRVWTDEKTGVQYIIYDRQDGYGGMGGITPRYNADGTLYTVDLQQ